MYTLHIIWTLITLCCISLRRCWFGLETRVTIKISIHPCYTRNFDWFPYGMKQKKFWKKNPKWNWVFQNLQFSIIAKISGMGPWVSRINWWEEHWCSSIYMVVRLSDVSSKRGWKHKKCIFSPFLSLLWTVWWPYRLSHMNALCII